MSANGPRVVVRESGSWSPSQRSGGSSGSIRGTIRTGAAATGPRAHAPVRGGNLTAWIVTTLVAFTTGLAIFDLWLLGTNF